MEPLKSSAITSSIAGGGGGEGAGGDGGSSGGGGTGGRPIRVTAGCGGRPFPLHVHPNGQTHEEQTVTGTVDTGGNAVDATVGEVNWT